MEKLKLALRYGANHLRSGRRMRRFIKQIYELLPPDYPERKAELRTVLAHKSRAEPEMRLCAVAIAQNNLYEDVPTIAAEMGMIAKSASMWDDVHDEWLVDYLAKEERVEVEYIRRKIGDKDFICSFAETQKPKYDPRTKRWVSPKHLAYGARHLEEFSISRIRKKSNKAYLTYLAGRDEILLPQAEDIYVGVMLRRNAIEHILKLYGPLSRYRSNTLRIGDKLAIMGSEGAVMVNQVTSREDEEQRLRNEALRSCIRPYTRFSQFGKDDVPRLEEDLENKTGNVFILHMLPDYQTLDLPTMRRFLRGTPEVTSFVFMSDVHRMFMGLERLRELEFMYEDMKIAIRRAGRKVKKNVRELERRLDVELDWTWYGRFEELRRSLD
jgi:hypothetical protein